MASTSTNKQPLLVDRVFHEFVDTNTAYNQSMDPAGNNAAGLLLNCISTDGAIVEDVYVISRIATSFKINFYLSTNNDYLRKSEAFFIGSIEANPAIGGIARMDLPQCLTPVPQHTDVKNTALYIPSNKALWVAREGDADISGGPIVGIQGGYF